MKPKLDKDFDAIKDILNQGKYELENPNFEDNLLFRLTSKNRRIAEVGKTVRYSLISFIIGLCLCIVLSSIFLLSDDFKLGSTSQTLCFASIFILGVVGVLIIENYLTLLRNYSTED